MDEVVEVEVVRAQNDEGCVTVYHACGAGGACQHPGFGSVGETGMCRGAPHPPALLATHTHAPLRNTLSLTRPSLPTLKERSLHISTNPYLSPTAGKQKQHMIMWRQSTLPHHPVASLLSYDLICLAIFGCVRVVRFSNTFD